MWLIGRLEHHGLRKEPSKSLSLLSRTGRCTGENCGAQQQDNSKKLDFELHDALLVQESSLLDPRKRRFVSMEFDTPLYLLSTRWYVLVKYEYSSS